MMASWSLAETIRHPVGEVTGNRNILKRGIIMDFLEMNKATFRQITSPYKHLITKAEDVEDIFNLVYDIIEAEADAMKVKSPWAKETIKEYENMASNVNILCSEVSDAWEEVYGK